MSAIMLFIVANRGGIPIFMVLNIASGSIAAYSWDNILRKPIIRFQGISL